jgi:hypothetical protein
MKNKTALKRSITSAKLLSVVVCLLGAVAFHWPNRYTLALLVLVSIILVGDFINIFYIRRKAAQDPAYLEKRIT